jgi:hypothetical protein
VLIAVLPPALEECRQALLADEADAPVTVNCL